MRRGFWCIVPAVLSCAPEAPPPDGLWSVNGTELYVRRVGAGEPIIVIHGGPLLEHGYFLPHLTPLSEHYDLVSYDQRLSGRSAGSVDSASVRIATFVADIEAIRAQLGARRVHVLGHSSGGQLALRYALAHGDRVASLILVSPMPRSTALWQQEEQALTARVTADDQDAIAPLTGHLLADSIPNARLATIPAAGHFAFVEQPEAFLHAVRSFLGTRNDSP